MGLGESVGENVGQNTGSSGFQLQVDSTPVPTPSLSIPDNTWYEVPNSSIMDVEATDPPFTNIWQGVASSVIGAFMWSGGAWDWTRDKFIVWGGGHNAYYGNEIYYFDLATLTWSRNDPSTPNAVSDCSSPLSDGNPNSRHTYANLVVLPNGNLFNSINGATSCSSGGIDTNNWDHDPDTDTWTILSIINGTSIDVGGQAPNGNNAQFAAYDPTNNAVYIGGSFGISEYDLDTNTFTRRSSTNLRGASGATDLAATVDTTRHNWIAIGEGRVWVYDLDTFSAPTNVSTTGGSFNGTGYRPGVTYDSISDVVLACGNDGIVYALDMDTYIWTAYAGHSQYVNEIGTYSRFHYMESENACMLVNGPEKNPTGWYLPPTDQNVLIYKLYNPAGTTYTVNPSNYTTFYSSLKPGDTVQFESGNYPNGLAISNLNGTSSAYITFTAEDTLNPPVFQGSGVRNTIHFTDCSYLNFNNLELDGLNLDGVDGFYSDGVCHHITIEENSIINHDGGQLTNGIRTYGPAWDFIIRRNRFIGTGTGMYLGQFTGDNGPFVGGTIEYNYFEDTIGYNMQIKPINSRDYSGGGTIPGMPTDTRKTIIRYNTFSKKIQPAGSIGARPNCLVSHFPATGNGSSDIYEVYGNFFYQNTNEALFQGEGNIAFYDNCCIHTGSSFAYAINITSQADQPQEISVFNNTIVAQGTGIRINNPDISYDQYVRGNAVFAATPLDLAANVTTDSNTIDTQANATTYLTAPAGDPSLGTLDLYPISGQLSGTAITVTPFTSYTSYNRDFNDTTRTFIFRGAYAGEGTNPGWTLDLDSRPAL